MKLALLFSLVIATSTLDRLRQQGSQAADNIRQQGSHVVNKIRGQSNPVCTLFKNMKSLFAKLRQKIPLMHDDKKQEEEQQAELTSEEQFNKFFERVQKKFQELQELQSENKLSSNTPGSEEEKKKSESSVNNAQDHVREEL